MGTSKNSRRGEKPYSVLPTRVGYDRWSGVYDSDGNPMLALEEPVVRRLLGNVKGLKAADIGCGTGRHAVYLAEHGADVLAMDFSDGMIQKACAKSKSKRIRFVRHDITKRLPLPNGAFDRVICCLVLEHIRNLDPFFRELGRICRKNGLIIISAMHPAMWFKGVSALFFDPATNRQLRPRSYPQKISDYMMAASHAELLIDHMSEHAPDGKLARKFPRVRNHIGWPMLLAMRLRRK